MIGRLLALALVVATAVLAREAAGGSSGPGGLFALGFALIAAALAGELLDRLGLPRVTGYLLFGLACGPYVANIITSAMARDLRLINGLAVVLIAFIAGLEINLRSLRPRLRALLRFSAGSLAVMYLLLAALLWAAWPWLGLAPAASGLERLAIVAVLTTLVVSFSPTVTMAVVAELRATGSFTEFLVAVVVIADLALIFGFTLVMQLARGVFGLAGGEQVSPFAYLAWEIPGSLAFGAVVGVLFALYLRHVGRELTLVLIAVCVTVSELGSALYFEPVLAALAAGLVVENIAPPEGHALKEAVERGALPVLIVFFVAAGASLQLDALAAVGIVALGIAVARVGAIVIGVRAGTRAAGLEPETGALVGYGLISQAGVTLGLTFLVANEFPAWGQPIQTLMLSLVALHQLVGPALLKVALTRAGEVGRLAETAALPDRQEPAPAR
jgi:Kef-type K+ transport system membrane component KefB